MAHLIAKNIIDLQVHTGLDGFELQQEVSHLFWRKMIPTIEDVFDRFTGAGNLVQIDRLVIDLGKISETALLRGDFIDQLAHLLEVELQRLKEERPQQLIYQSLAQGHFEQWLLFLRQGYFTWHNNKPNTNWNRDVLDTLGRKASAVNRLRQLVKTSELAQLRLLLQHPATFLKTLLELYTGHKQDKVLAALAELLALAGQMSPFQVAYTSLSSVERQLELTFWKVVLQKAMLDIGKPDAMSLVQHFVVRAFTPGSIRTLQQRSNKSLYPLLHRACKSATNERGPDIELDSQGKAVLKKKKSKDKPSKAKGLKADKNSEIGQAAAKLSQGEEAPQPAIRKKGGKNKADKQQKKAKKASRSKQKASAKAKRRNHPNEQPQQVKQKHREDPVKTDTAPLIRPDLWGTDIHPSKPDIEKPTLGPDESLFITTAGIVLLHPFLSNFFGKLGLLKDGLLEHEGARQRAVYLLHYLGTGEENLPEFELILPKILCGIPIHWPLDHAIELTVQEKQEGERLLAAIIEHWGVLGSTSPASLREGFLKRDGKLRTGQLGWRLQVERKTLDILLERLPWGLGMMKLPWMEKILQVEW